MAPYITAAADNAAARSTKATGGNNRAYVTFLAGNGDCVKGVVGLAKGLRKVESAYPLVVAVLPDVPEEFNKILISEGCIVREIEPVYPPENQTQCAKAHYSINYSKLRIWEFVEYSKMIYLDGDIQVFGNIDHLFDLPNHCFYGVMDCLCGKSWSKTPQYQIGYCQQCPDKVQWPSHFGPKPPLYFNAGIFVCEPSLAAYHDLLDVLKVTTPTLSAEQETRRRQLSSSLGGTGKVLGIDMASETTELFDTNVSSGELLDTNVSSGVESKLLPGFVVHSAFLQIAIGILQLHCQGSSPFESRPYNAWAFLFAMFIHYAAALYYAKCWLEGFKSSKIVEIVGHMSGSLAAAAFLSILLPPNFELLVFAIWVLHLPIYVDGACDWFLNVPQKVYRFFWKGNTGSNDQGAN